MIVDDYQSDTVTEGIRVRVTTQFLPEQSDLRRGMRFFAYTILISNEGDRPARLISRHWIITDGWGHVEEVKGPGVVGKTPYLRPGESFEYTSGCPLPTSTGSMEGTYQMQRDDGTSFDVRIGRFLLAEPGAVN
ncbi:MAG: Protein ApaG [Myxococcota bacterium]|nr:Protein ApaG [Myxococcota bacterium]